MANSKAKVDQLNAEDIWRGIGMLGTRGKTKDFKRRQKQ